jgi:uncharacterized membrane protein YfcA
MKKSSEYAIYFFGSALIVLAIKKLAPMKQHISNDIAIGAAVSSLGVIGGISEKKLEIPALFALGSSVGIWIANKTPQLPNPHTHTLTKE